MTEKIIDEVMGLVYSYTQLTMKALSSSQEDREKSVLEAAEGCDAIRAKLREVLERKPLSDGEIAAMASNATKSVEFATRYVTNPLELARSIERAHKIGAEQ